MTATLTPTNATDADHNSDFNAIDFMIRQALSRLGTSMVVQVKAVNGIGVNPVGFVDVQPMVNQVDSAGAPVPHGIISNLPYFRMQGGTNAIICDPVVGDIGVAVFASRDISKVKATRAPAVPNSRRKFALADGMYFGGLLNGAPSQYVILDTVGIRVVSPTAITFTAPHITMTSSNPVVITNDANIDGRLFSTHEHSGVTSGSSNTGPVV